MHTHLIARRRKKQSNYLNRIKTPEVEHLSSLRRAADGPPQLGAGVGIMDAWADLGPVPALGHPVLEPAGVVLQVVVLVGPAGLGPAGAGGGDGEGEDDEGEEGGDDEEHEEEVEPEEPGDAVAGAGEAHEGDDHDGGTHGDDGPLQEAEAVCLRRLAAQPYPSGQDGDGEQEGHEVHKAYHTVACPQHVDLLLPLDVLWYV